MSAVSTSGWTSTTDRPSERSFPKLPLVFGLFPTAIHNLRTYPTSTVSKVWLPGQAFIAKVFPLLQLWRSGMRPRRFCWEACCHGSRAQAGIARPELASCIAGSHPAYGCHPLREIGANSDSRADSVGPHLSSC